MVKRYYYTIGEPSENRMKDGGQSSGWVVKSSAREAAIGGDVLDARFVFIITESGAENLEALPPPARFIEAVCWL
ncbi:hypothetical protein L596_028518 [Steinernema carpocapsae]|uniref:Uncharacterized protein n=1 Tax=Steinernema carpocapsae TaxID=34508 RepID=A0A4U5LYR2_STECR|nr:hypothetical protein L596_028518 [Steinernema carpocapsae]